MDKCENTVLNERAQSLLNSLISKLAIEHCAIHISPGNARGDNYLGVIAKVHVKAKDASWYWIVKCAPEASQFRVFVPITTVYGREVYMYENILTEYQLLQDEKGISPPFRSYPKYYSSVLEEPYETIIMEDLKAIGYRMYNRQEPLDYDHVMLVMREFGRFHALSFAIRDQKPDLFREFENKIPDVFADILFGNEGSKRMVEHQCSQVIESYDDEIDHKGPYDKFIRFQDDMFERIKKLLTVEAAGRYGAISHGDSWINNFLFKYSGANQSPTGMCFIDWQMARVGSPVLDLSYFLFTSTDKKLRDRYYDSIINEYYCSLSSFLLKLGSDPETLYPLHVFQQQLKKFSVYGLFMAVQILYFMLSDKEEIPDVHNFESEEDALEQMKYVPKNIDKYLTRVKEIILDFDKYDYEL